MNVIQTDLPGVLILECMIQTAGVLLRRRLDPAESVALLGSLERVRFRKPVGPGDRLAADVALVGRRGILSRFRAEAAVNGRAVCQAEFTIGRRIDPLPDLPPEADDRPLALDGVPLADLPVQGADAIMRIIPHRFPFLLVDALYSVSDNRVVGLKNVSGNEAFFNGHFPSCPVMPGTLMVGTLAQVGAVCVLNRPGNAGKMPFFMGVEHARFRQPVRPGDRLIVDVRQTVFRQNVGKADGRILIGSGLAAEARISFALVERPPAG